MYFLVDSKTKVIFGWSGKSGCSHIKKIYWYLQNNILDNPIHIPSKERDKLPIDIDEYITILIVRNPYERLVSGFFDKYKPTGEFRKKWPEETLCFSKFIDTLIKPDWKKIERHHFCPQTEDDFNNSILCKSKELILYDIKNIDYSFIEKLYKKNIPQKLIDFRGGHENRKTVVLEEKIYDTDILIYFDKRIDTKYFYNEDIKNKVFNFYINDFNFFKEHGFDYTRFDI